jgi:hypothetical protein
LRRLKRPVRIFYTGILLATVDLKGETAWHIRMTGGTP